MADIERRTRLARLLIAPASFVYDELKRYGAEVQASPYAAQSDELEQALAGRNDPLIDLGLAAYGANRRGDTRKLLLLRRLSYSYRMGWRVHLPQLHL